MFLISVAAVAVAVTGCGGSGSTASQGSSGVPAASSLSAPAGTAPTRPPSAGTSHASTTSPRPSASTAATADGSPATAAAGSSATPAASRGTAGRVPLPPPGTYKYHVTGHSSSFFGSQQINDTATLNVDKPSGDTEHTKQQDQSGSTEQVLVSRAGGLYLAELHLSQTGFDEDFKPASSALLFPTNAHQGRQWHWSMASTDGKYTLHAQLTVASMNASTVSIASVLHIQGNNFDITVHQRDDSGRDAVILREHAVTNGTAYGTKVNSDVTSVLTSRPH